MPKPDNEDHKKGLRHRIRSGVKIKVLEVVSNGMDEKKIAEQVAKLRREFKTLPNDALVRILIKRAVRKTTLEGMADGAAITVLEGVIAAPNPEPASKAAAVAGIVALISGDVAYTTRVQMQLLLEIAQIYDCPYAKGSEEDVWLIFRAALGMRGVERMSPHIRYIFVETAKKQFRKLLRTGIRKALQDRVVKLAGRQVGKYLSEKALMRLVPVVNVAIGGAINNRVTKSVGKWAKVKAIVRSSTLNQLRDLDSGTSDDRIWILPIIFQVGTADDKLTDNTLTHYAHTLKNLALTDEEMVRVTELNEDDKLSSIFKQELPEISNKKMKDVLFDVALTAAAVNLKETDMHHECLRELGGFLGIKYKKSLLTEKIHGLKL